MDLNYPDFQDELFDLEPPELKKVFKTLRKLRKLTWNQLFNDKGLRWEQPKNMQGLYTIRLSQGYRAVVVRQAEFIRFISLHPDHDSAYK